MSQATRARLVAFLSDLLRQVGYWVREYFGENHYSRYLAAWQVHHAGVPSDGTHRPMNEREFFAQRIQVRFGGGVQRC